MKSVAETIKKMVSSDTMTAILDRSVILDANIERDLIEHWSYDLYSRRPGPAFFENGVLMPTDLDLACFLSALVSRKAVINIPQYKARRAATTREGEHVLSKENRHGKVMGLSANREAFSFSIRMNDMNVVQAGQNGEEDTIGAPRNFMLVDVNGHWHDGWTRIQFMPSAPENDFLKDRKLWTDNTVVFKNFVHPNRWVSYYGQYYFLTKALIQRMEEENTWRRKEEKRLLEAGIRFPLTGEGARKEWPESETGDSKPIKVWALEAEIDAPWVGTFPLVVCSQAALVANAALIKERQYHTLPMLRFATRATELALYKIGLHQMPAWIQGAKWEEGYVQKGKRTEWNRLVLHQLFPGQIGFALRHRVYQKTERVAP